MGAVKLLAIFFALKSMAEVEVETRVSYGGECNMTAKCDSRARLRCNDGQCGCLKLEEMMYDENIQKCVVKAGERCKFMLGESGGSSVLFDFLPCINGSTCSTEGFCNCVPSFYEIAEGICAPSKGYNETCNSKTKCSSLKGLECQDGICGCNGLKSEYNMSFDQCVGLAGQECVNGHCTGYANCLANMCVCGDGYFADDSRNCQPRRGVLRNCTGDFQCENTDDRPLKCVGGQCVCNPASSVYGQISKTIQLGPGRFQMRSYAGCLPLPGQACSKDGLCSARSHCVKGTNQAIVVSSDPRQTWLELEYVRKQEGQTDDDDNDGTCACQSDFALSASNRCGRPFGACCYTHDECLDGLVCEDNACACELDTQTFSQSQRKCTSKIRGPCKSYSDCELNAHCKLISGYSTGHCICRSGFVPNKNGSCDVQHGRQCFMFSKCDSIAELQCINGICKCGNFALYDEERRKCVGKVGADCEMGVPYECVEHAHCEHGHPKLPAECSCDPGYVEVGNYTCMASDTLLEKVIEQEETTEVP